MPEISKRTSSYHQPVAVLPKLFSALKYAGQVQEHLYLEELQKKPRKLGFWLRIVTSCVRTIVVFVFHKFIGKASGRHFLQ
jgi:hypothetical protein